MDAPDRQLEPSRLGRFAPSQDVLIDAIDKRSVEIEEKRQGIRIESACHLDQLSNFASIVIVVLSSLEMGQPVLAA